MLISEEYRKLNHDLHLSDDGYGKTLPKFVKLIKPLVRPGDTVLNYGCGKSMLTCGAINRVTNYDPAIPGLDAPPEPADVVICTDVLEHVEPECLDEVLDHLQTLTRRDAFFTVATVPSSKTLADGRNTHLTQKPPQLLCAKPSS